MDDATGRQGDGRAVTILDVARAAGVSKSTVSRVLDERYPLSKSANADKVRRAARELGYHRDVFASGLRQGKTHTVGVVVPRLTDTAMATFFEAVSRVCDSRGRFAVVATTDHEPDGARRAVETLVKRRVDGLVFAADRRGDPTAERLGVLGIPHVCALRGEGGSPRALGDDVLGGYLATRHLMDLGHRQIALLNGPSFASNARGREEGYRAAQDEQGWRPHDGLVHSTDFTVDCAAAATESLLDASTEFTAIFAATDNIAIGAVSALTRRGLRVPDDVSIVGYNDIPLARHFPVPLTSVRIPFDEIAANAIDLLDDAGARQGGEFPTRVSTPTLIPRASTRRL